MAVVIPFIGAAVGWLAGGTAMWAQVGWMVGTMIYNASQPGPTISAGNPSTAPSVGSDIRGQNIPVIFGTVRCSGYLIWQNNFKAIKASRKVGSGKKKSKQEYYEYTWDFIYHCGMVTQPYRIVGMWEGSERVQDSSMSPIIFADGSIFHPAVHSEQQENLAQSMGPGFWNLMIGAARAKQMETAQAAKTAAWAEAYWYGGHDSAAAENGWAYFQSQTAAPNVRWPNTIWIGFKTLELGEQPRVPQYNFEVSPDGGAIQNTFYNQTLITSNPATSDTLPLSVTANGRYLVQLDDASAAANSALQAIDMFSGAVTDSLTPADFRLMFSQYVLDELSDTNFKAVLPIAGTNDFVAIFSGLYSPGPANEQVTTFCYVFLDETTGLFSSLGSYSDHFNLPVRIASTNMYCAGLDRDQRYVVIIGEIINANGDIHIWSTPYPRTTSDDTVVQTDVSATMDGGMMSSLNTTDDLAANTALSGFMIPMADGSVRWYFYVNNQRIAYNLTGNTVIATFGATYANGFLAYIEIDPAAATILSGPNIAHGDFDQMGPPFNNAILNEDGSPATGNVGYKERFFIGPSNMAEQDTSWVVIFERDLSDAANALPNGMAHTIRTFELEVQVGAFTFVPNEEFQLLEDVPLTYGIPDGDRFTWERGDMMMAYAPLTGEMWRIGRTWNGANNYTFSAKVGRARIGIIDLTPPEIIKEIFCNAVVGFGKDEATQVDADTYDAAHQYCIENGILVSGVFAASAERVSVFENLVNVYGGWVAWNGYKLKFGKPTEVFSSVFTIDNTCFVQPDAKNPKPPFSGKRQALQDTTNKVTVKYYDRQLSYRQNEVTLGDEIDQDLNGVRQKTLNTMLVMHQDTAYRLAERMLWGNMYARNIYDDVLVGWKCEHLEPGDPVTLVDSFSNTNVNARIVRREEVKRGNFKLVLVEELDYLGKSKALVERPLPTVRGIPTTTEKALDFDAYEMPSEFQKEGPRYYVGYAPGGPTAAAGLYTSPSTTGFTRLLQTMPFPDGGRIKTTFPENEDVMTDVLVVVNAKSGSNPNSIDVWFEGEIPDYTSFERASGYSMFRVGSEMCAYEGATLVGSNVYRLDRVFRGIGGTEIKAHSPGDVWWSHRPDDGGGLFSIPYASDQIGTDFYYKVVPVGFDGVEYDPTSIDYKHYVIAGDHFTPRALQRDDLRFLVGTDTITAPASLANIYGAQAGDGRRYINPYFVRAVGSSDERNIAVQWPETSQATGYGAQGYGTVPYGNFQADLDPVTWDLQIVGSGSTVVRCVSVTTPYYFYGALDNVSDNGAWRGNVAFSVRPRNVYGLAPHAAVRSLQLTV